MLLGSVDQMITFACNKPEILLKLKREAKLYKPLIQLATHVNRLVDCERKISLQEEGQSYKRSSLISLHGALLIGRSETKLQSFLSKLFLKEKRGMLDCGE